MQVIFYFDVKGQKGPKESNFVFLSVLGSLSLALSWLVYFFSLFVFLPIDFKFVSLCV